MLDAELAVGIARELDFSENELDVLGVAAILHDYGKIGVPDSILLKPEALTAAEREVIHRHCEIGHGIIRSGAWLKEAAEIIYSHHERYDGKGYPRGLKGTEICLGARIFTVADAYDAMRSDRVYSKATPAEKAAAEISNNRGRQFDPAVVDAFLARVAEIETSVYRNAASAPREVGPQ